MRNRRLIPVFLLFALIFAFAAKISSAGAEPATVVFQLSGGLDGITGEQVVFLSTTTNPGLSGASLEIQYDSTEVKFVSYQFDDAFLVSERLVSDNKSGTIRFTFANRTGFYTRTGIMLTLRFASQGNNTPHSYIRIPYQKGAVAGTHYQSMPYECNEYIPVTTPFTLRAGSTYCVNHEEKTVSAIPFSTSPKTFTENFLSSVTVPDGLTYVGTGTLADGDGAVYALSVTGDLDGNGKLSSTDYLYLRRQLLGSLTLAGVYQKAGDINGDGRISASDYLLLRQALFGVVKIQPR